jgi:Fe-S-cluster containining protein
MRTCKECTGECCKGTVAYHKDSGLSTEERIKPGLSENPMDNSHAAILKAGYTECNDHHETCEHYENGCKIYSSRPLLCRTYYCHGKYFKRKL